MNTLGTTLVGNAKLVCRQYPPVALPPCTPSGAAMPVPLRDRRPLPAGGFGPGTRREVLQNEGATIGWHYILIRNMYAAINCPAVSGGGRTGAQPAQQPPRTALAANAPAPPNLAQPPAL